MRVAAKTASASGDLARTSRGLGWLRRLSLCLLCGLAFPITVGAADVAYFGVVKSAQYLQTNDLAPVPLNGSAYAFTAFVVGSTNNVVTNATVKPSNTTPLRVLTPDTNGVSLRFGEQFSSQAALDMVYPTSSGLTPTTYAMTMDTVHDGVHSASLSFYLLIFPLSYPATPQLTNLAAAQTIDTTRDFELRWNPLGGGALAIVQLTLLDAASNLVFATPAPFQPGALNGSSTSTVIPAYALPPGATLDGHLTIANPGNPNTNSYPGAIGIAALAKDTQFPLAARAAPARPQLEVLPPSAGRFRLRLTGEPDRVYQIQATGDFVSWTNLFVTNCVLGTFDYADPASVVLPWRFYRGKVGQ